MSKTKSDIIGGPDPDLCSGFTRLHVMHHAAEGPIYGLAMSEELARHGYRISPGTLYPLLHGLEQKGYLRSRRRPLGRTFRREYLATVRGKKALEAARHKIRELFEELIEGK
jgi:DNA-binding PadR family transcriptional regulator